MNIDQFKIRNISFEVRYDLNLLHWDRTGRFWTKWLTIVPDAKLSAAAPNEVTFGSDKYRAQTALDKSHITGVGQHANIKDFAEKASSFVDILSDTFEISSFTRLGFRLVFQRRFPDKKSASEALLELNLLRVPTEERFGIRGAHPSDPEYAIRIEGVDLGILVRIKQQELRLNVALPDDLDPDIKSGERVYHELNYDIDYYTVNTVLASQVRAKDWIEGANHAIRRDSFTFLGA